MNPEEMRYLFYLAVGGAATVALAPIFVALRPDRHALAVERVETAPGACLAWGLLPALALGATFCVLATAQLPIGSGAVLILTGLICGLGAGISGRALGARLAEDGTPLRQTLIGTALICGAAQWPLAGLVIYVIAVTMGLGGWLCAKSKSA